MGRALWHATPCPSPPLVLEPVPPQLCKPYGGPLLAWHPVAPDMNKKEYDKPDAAMVGTMEVRWGQGSVKRENPGGLGG